MKKFFLKTSSFCKNTSSAQALFVQILYKFLDMNFAIRNVQIGTDHMREIKVVICFMHPIFNPFTRKYVNVSRIKKLAIALQWENNPIYETFIDLKLNDLISKAAEKWMNSVRDKHPCVKFEFINVEWYFFSKLLNLLFVKFSCDSFFL